MLFLENAYSMLGFPLAEAMDYWWEYYPKHYIVFVNFGIVGD